MRRFLTPPVRLAVAALLGGLATLSLPTHAQDAASSPASGDNAKPDAVAACERAARQALSPQAADAEVAFNAAPREQDVLSNGNHTVLRGSGRLRSPGGMRGFSYSCNVDLRSANVTGVVVRETPAAAAAPARAPAEPDLSHVSPRACESDAAVALKKRWPRVSQISFDSATRRLLQDAAGRAELRGRGSALPTPDSPSTHFGFECVFDPRDGRVLGTRISG
jgi:hypothetical protein